MTVFVVDLLEVVDVEHDERQAPVAGLGIGVDPYKFLVEFHAVVELRQRIATRELVRLLELFVQLVLEYAVVGYHRGKYDVEFLDLEPEPVVLRAQYH